MKYQLVDKLFIYGSFDFKKKGLGFAYSGAGIRTDDEVRIRKTIERIGNYSGDKSIVHWLVQKLNSEYLILVFSFGGKDEHGRNTFISKGFILSGGEYEEFDYFPFLLLPLLDLNYQSLKKEVINEKPKSINVKFRYDFAKAHQAIKKDKPNIRKYCLSLWTNSKVTFPRSEKYLDILEAIFLASKLKQRKDLTFVTCDSMGMNDTKVRFQEGISSPKFTEVKHKILSKSFSTISSIISEKDDDRYSDFILEKGEFKPKSLWESIKNLNFNN